jgi:hypothetical protein
MHLSMRGKIGVFMALALLGGGVVGYRYLATQAAGGVPNWLFPERATTLVFTPAPSVLAERTKFVVGQVAPELISTTLPISASAVPVNLGTFVVPVPTQMNNQLAAQLGSMHGATQEISATGAVNAPATAQLVRYENSELCDANGACPTVLIQSGQGGAAGGQDEIIFALRAKRVWLTSAKVHGNPDIIVDYGTPGMPPVRMYWDPTAQYPSYQAYPPSGPLPLPPLPEAR